MLAKTVEYTDYNDNKASETLYFNLTKSEVLDLQYLQPEFEKWQRVAKEEKRELTTAEVTEMLNLIKLLIEKSYGERSEDGKRFVKNQKVYTDFTQTAVYDEFVFGLFQNPDEAYKFMSGILPKDLVTGLPAPADDGGDIPSYQVENRDPTPAEFAKMTDAEKLAAFQWKSSKS